MSTVTPACTTTQLLLSNTESCILPQRIIDLSMLLQNNPKVQVVSSNGIGPLRPKVFDNLIQSVEPPAALQLKKPLWIESHTYRRASRTNSNHLRVLTTEVNMIRAMKITRSLRPRLSYRSGRNDEFVWGRPSSLRESSII